MLLKPNEVLFAVNSSGRIHYLHSSSSSDGGQDVQNTSQWLELPYLGVDFKRLSAVVAPASSGTAAGSSADVASPARGRGRAASAASGREVGFGSGGRLWALGGDHQVYVFVFGVEVPIRVQEHTYENQRWNPIEGFCSSLLPTDRPKFSSGDGTRAKDRDKVKLPTMAWRWEGDWYLDTNYGGKQLDKDGWTYAIDFPAEYHAKKSFSSCVRRRKWIRYRKYVATDSWSAVPSIHKDISKEPFMDISVGGHELPNGDPNELQVWAVTILGRVFARQSVTTTCPEGTGWLRIPTPDSCEVGQISVSPSGLIWAVTLSGKALVRLGVSRMEPRGTSWAVLDSPNPRSQLSHVCVGESAVWALSRDRRLWLRNGIRAASSGDNDVLAKGTKWIEMVGEMLMITMGPGDQVFGITDDDRALVFRTGVSHSDLSGKTWRPLTARTVRMRSASGGSRSIATRRSHDRDCSSASGSSPATSLQEGTSNSQFRQRARDLAEQKELQQRLSESTEGPDSPHPSTSTASTASSSPPVVDKRQAVPRGIDQSMYESAVDSLDKLKAGDDDRSSGAPADAASDSINVLDREDIYDVDEAADFGDSQEPQWVWLTAGACSVDQLTGPPSGWFLEDAKSTSSQLSLSGEPWRVEILQNLRDKNEENSRNFGDYDTAIERTSWVKKLEAKFHSGDPRARWELCSVELEQTGSPQGGIDFGTLSIFGINNKKTKEHLSLLEITCVYQISDKTLAIQTPERSLKLQPLQLRFTGDLDMQAFQADLVHGMNTVHGINSAPAFPGSVLSVTARGEVLAFDPRVSLDDRDAAGAAAGGAREDAGAGSRFMQDLDVKGRDVPLVRVLENGFSRGSVLSVSFRPAEDGQRFSINLQTGRPSLEADVALHFNPRMDANLTVLNTRRSSEWMVEERHPLLVVNDDGASAGPAFVPGRQAQVVIKAEDNHYQILVDGYPYCRFGHRVKPENVTHVRLGGDLVPHAAVYQSRSLIIPPSEMYWRCLGGGHFLSAETNCAGVTWALGYDSRPWVHTGGWGGAHFKGVASSKFGINQVEDSKYFYIYENQRWNPLTGFTIRGLPTDRPNWSDRSGKLALSKETAKLPSVYWQWTTDWLIDYTTPGGTDEHGWQYAKDFPTTYHGGPAGFTDYVRRRRWARKCRLQTTGPWRQVGSTKLIEVSMAGRPGTDLVDVWAVASNGAALYRQGVRANCPDGSGWTHVHADTQFQSVSVGPGGRVWVVAKDGSAFLRHGITDLVPTGQLWLHVSQPQNGLANNNLRSVTVGDSVWATDAGNRLYLRQEVTHVFPEGTSWQQVATGIKSASASHNELWAVLESAAPATLVSGIVTALQTVGGVAPAGENSGAGGSDDGAPGGAGGEGARGVLARRSGITPDNPVGTGWDIATGGGWKHISIRGKHQNH